MVFRARDGRVGKTGLEDELLERFEVAHARELLNKLYSGEFSEPEIAGLVPLVDSLARQGDEPAYHGTGSRLSVGACHGDSGQVG
jgi:N-acetylglucosamine kinase-like BadF-type ATPase